MQEIGHPATLFPMVESGIGISVLPALALPLPQGSRLQVKRLTPVVERQLMLAQRKKSLSVDRGAGAMGNRTRRGRKPDISQGRGPAVSALSVILNAGGERYFLYCTIVDISFSHAW